MEQQPDNRSRYRLILDRLQDDEFLPGLLATNISPAVPREQIQTTLDTLVAYSDAIQRRLYFADEDQPEYEVPEELRPRLFEQQRQIAAEIVQFRVSREKLHLIEQFYYVVDGIVRPEDVQVCIDGSIILSDADREHARTLLAETFEYTPQSMDDVGYATEVMAYRERQLATEAMEFDDELRFDIANTLLAFFHNHYEGTELYDALTFTVRRIRTLVWRGVQSGHQLDSFVALFRQQARAFGIPEEQVTNEVDILLTPPDYNPFSE